MDHCERRPKAIETNARYRALTIAGFDPSGGAGVLADARTFVAFGLQALAAITSLTFQNASRVVGVTHLTGDAVRAQVLPLLEEGNKIVCSKIGMLPTREVVMEVARLFRESYLPSPVVDPVMRSTSGHVLMEPDALDSFIAELLPLARLVTPNISEAEQLTSLTITSEVEMRDAAARIRGMGARSVLIKGGHLGEQAAGGRRQTTDDRHQDAAGRWKEERTGSADDELGLGEDAIDVLDDEGEVTVFREERVVGGRLHGSGCILSTAISAGLGSGRSLKDSVAAAKTFVLDAIREASHG